MSISSSTRRILRDLKQWRECSSEVPTINAWPLENDIYEWHANMITNDGLLKGISFHLIINFPKNYPSSPPSIELCNYLKHPNVFQTGVYGDTKSNKGYWICLDMLKEYTRSEKYKGWTSAYSITSILLQLQSFLIGDKVEQMGGNVVELNKYLTKDATDKIKTESHQFKCNKCHKYNADIKQVEKMDTKANKECNLNNYWKLLYQDTENMILSYLTYKDCTYFNCVCLQFREIIERNKVFELKRFGCWYHRIDLSYCQNNNKIQSFEDVKVLNNMILGYGFTPIFYQRLSDNPYFNDFLDDITLDANENENLKFIRLKDCDITFDILSYDAFNKHKVRTTVWKEKRFTHFLPIYINKKHSKKSIKLFEEICLNIFQDKARSNYKFIPNEYHPMMGIHLVMTIMSSLVVSVNRSGNKPSLSLYYSINVIETYMHLYHLLLSIYNQYIHTVRPIIDQKCTNFVFYQSLRRKKYIPNFGTFKLYFILQKKYKWNDIIQPFISEAFVRKVKWLVNKYPSLRTVSEYEDEEYRINCTWRVSKKRGFMFQYFFLNYCCEIGKTSPLNKFEQFEQNFGCSAKGLPLKFQMFVKQIYSVKSIYAFFDIVGIHCADKEFVYKLLADACKKSLSYGYHKETAYTSRRYRSYRW